MNARTTWIDEVLEGLSPLVTPAEIQERARIRRRKVNQLVADRRLDSVKHAAGGSSRLLITRESLARYLRSITVV